MVWFGGGRLKLDFSELGEVGRLFEFRLDCDVRWFCGDLSTTMVLLADFARAMVFSGRVFQLLQSQSVSR